MKAEQNIYLDYNATTPLKSLVKQEVIEALEIVGNPSSIHQYGQNARSRIEKARKKIADMMGCRESNIIFTGSATEANNTVLNGLPECVKILACATEHPSVLKANPQIQTLPVHTNGLLDLEILEQELKKTESKCLVSVQAVNSETGVVQPVKEIARIVHMHNGTFHCDAVQAMGRIPFDYLECGADFITLTAHKLGGPQGIGALIAADLKPFDPFIKGGGQEKRRRAGTENVAGILGFAKALESAVTDIDAYNEKLRPLQKQIEDTLLSKNIGVKIVGSDAPRVCNTINIITPKISAETQLMFMDINGVAVSSGSACSSGTVKASHVLKAMGINDDLASCSLRVSMGWNTAPEDIKHFLSVYDDMIRVNIRS